VQRNATAVGGARGSDHLLRRVRPRGPLSAELVDRLTAEPQLLPDLESLALEAVTDGTCTLTDADIQLSLTVLYELHYRSFDDVDDRWEWHPDLMGAAACLEAAFEGDLRALVAPRLPADPVASAGVADALADLVTADDSPSLGKHLARHGTTAQYAELLTHRSMYHLREADSHTWTIPRLAGPAKAALVEIQADEYGSGHADWMHSALFAVSMRGLGLDDSYGRYLNDVPAITLAWANTMTLFGLHRRLRGASAGHLAALEMTSSLPNRRYADGLRRLGFDADTTRFFDEHVEADAVHEQIAAHDLAGRLATAEPRLVEDILFGAAAALAIDGRVAADLLTAWASGGSLLGSASLPVTTISANRGDIDLVASSRG